MKQQRGRSRRRDAASYALAAAALAVLFAYYGSPLPQAAAPVPPPSPLPTPPLPPPPPPSPAAPKNGAADWYRAYQGACAAQPQWQEAVEEYASWHASALALLQQGGAADGPRPQLSVYRIPRGDAKIGVGCLLPGLASVFLSAMRRRRLFLLDWEGTEGAFGPPASGLQLRADWRALAASLGPAASRGLYELSPDLFPLVSGDGAPQLWGADATAFDLEVHTVFNRGVFTGKGGTPSQADEGWLRATLPRAHGHLAFGCVYAAVAPLTLAVLRRAGGAAALPAPAPPPAPPASQPPAPLVCLHLRTWMLDPQPHVPVLPHEQSPFVRASLRCLAHVLAAHPGSPLFVSADDTAVRRLVAARFGAEREVRFAAAPPQHTGFLDGEASAAQLASAYASSLSDWLLLAHCPVLVMSAASGFARSAAAAGWGNTLWHVDEDWLGGRVTDAEPCHAMTGLNRELTKGVGAGW